jgi:hypothetical protein
MHSARTQYAKSDGKPSAQMQVPGLQLSQVGDQIHRGATFASGETLDFGEQLRVREP